MITESNSTLSESPLDIIVAKTIENQELTIDNTKFIDCILINCLLEYSGKPVEFERTRLKHCRYVFLGDAKRFVDFLQVAGIIPVNLSDLEEASKLVH